MLTEDTKVTTGVLLCTHALQRQARSVMHPTSDADRHPTSDAAVRCGSSRKGTETQLRGIVKRLWSHRDSVTNFLARTPNISASNHLDSLLLI